MTGHDTATRARRRLRTALLGVDRLAARDVLHENGRTSFESIDQLIVPTLEGIGLGWEEGSVSLSQVYMASRIAEELVEELLPADAVADRAAPRVGITALEDYHLLGLRIVYAALRASGVAVINYGRATVEEAVENSRRDGLRVLLVSVLMLPAALRIRDLMDALAREEAPPSVIAGGAPFRFDAQLRDEVGVDLVGDSATDAVALVRQALGGAP